MTGHDRDAGRVSVFLAIALLAVFMVIGLSIDGAGELSARQRAHALAAEAARAGGQTIDEGAAIQGGPKVLDRAGAKRDAEAYLRTAGVRGVATPSDDLRSITVQVTTTYHPLMLSIFGWDESIPITDTATAVLLDAPPAP